MPASKDPVIEARRCAAISVAHKGKPKSEAHRLALRGPKKNRKNAYDTNFFDSWNPVMAYVFGFIMADGNVYKNTISIELSARDEEFLKGIASVVKSSAPFDYRIIVSKTTNYVGRYVRLRINSCIWRERLSNLGCSSNKKLTMVFPEVPGQFLSHFVRGYCDGDGCVVANGRSFRVVGNIKFIREMQKRVAKLIGATGYTQIRTYGRKHALAHLIYDNKMAIKFGDFIYMDKDKSLYLRRKFDRFFPYKQWSVLYSLKTSPLSYTDDFLFGELRKAIIYFGHPPSRKEFKEYRLGLDYDCPSEVTYWKRFGGWGESKKLVQVGFV
jgi:hypothetical protein